MEVCEHEAHVALGALDQAQCDEIGPDLIDKGDDRVGLRRREGEQAAHRNSSGGRNRRLAG